MQDMSDASLWNYREPAFKTFGLEDMSAFFSAANVTIKQHYDVEYVTYNRGYVSII